MNIKNKIQFGGMVTVVVSVLVTVLIAQVKPTVTTPSTGTAASTYSRPVSNERKSALSSQVILAMMANTRAKDAQTEAVREGDKYVALVNTTLKSMNLDPAKCGYDVLTGNMVCTK